ncbi:MAG: ankyrin repeat domain-containing protein [Colwellia sp.]|nr:ankyrin repeat domain-containing protein [Colwellia sp.]
MELYLPEPILQDEDDVYKLSIAHINRIIEINKYCASINTTLTQIINNLKENNFEYIMMTKDQITELLQEMFDCIDSDTSTFLISNKPVFVRHDIIKNTFFDPDTKSGFADSEAISSENGLLLKMLSDFDFRDSLEHTQISPEDLGNALKFNLVRIGALNYESVFDDFNHQQQREIVVNIPDFNFELILNSEYNWRNYIDLHDSNDNTMLIQLIKSEIEVSKIKDLINQSIELQAGENGIALENNLLEPWHVNGNNRTALQESIIISNNFSTKDEKDKYRMGIVHRIIETSTKRFPMYNMDLPLHDQNGWISASNPGHVDNDGNTALLLMLIDGVSLRYFDSLTNGIMLLLTTTGTEIPMFHKGWTTSCNPGQVNNNNETALMRLCSHNRISYSKLSMQILEFQSPKKGKYASKEIDLNLGQVNNDGNTVLMIACKNGLTKVVNKLLTIMKKLKAHKRDDDIFNIGQVNNDGMTALMYACCEGMQTAVKNIIAFNKTNLEQVNNNGDTALTLNTAHIYVASTKITQMLINVGVNLGHINGRGQTALLLSCVYNKKTALILINAGESPDGPNMALLGNIDGRMLTPLIHAISSKFVEVINRLLDSPESNPCYVLPDGRTALSMSFRHINKPGFQNIYNRLVHLCS